LPFGGFSGIASLMGRGHPGASKWLRAEQKDICFLIPIGNHMSRCGANFRTQVLMHKAQ
jgi:hypothetical protein